MDHMNYKLINVTPPAAIVDNAAFTTGAIDTKGFDHARIIVQLGAIDIAAVALKVQESDASGSGFADVTGLVFGTSTDIDGSTSALPSADDDNKLFTFDISLRGRKRYLDVSLTGGDGSAGTYASVLCELFHGEQCPVTKTARGVAGALAV